MKKKVLVTTGTRAEYGILRPLLGAIIKSKKLRLLLVVTGTHLSKKHGLTVNEIKKDGFKISATIKNIPKHDTNYDITKALGKSIIEFSKIFYKFKPDINVVLGDRDEMLASTIVASHMNIPNVHIAGGDKSGGIDEYNRHAITKLSNIHFTATKKSLERVIKMGENPKYVLLSGSLAIDEVVANKITSKKDLEMKYGIRFNGDEILLLNHPITTNPTKNENQIRNILNAIVKLKKTTITIAPNSDAGNKVIFGYLKSYSKKYRFIKVYESLPRSDYLGMLKNAGVLVGNSSSGMIEASCFSIPVINVGIRQKGRECGRNVIDVYRDHSSSIYYAILNALRKKSYGKIIVNSIYGDGQAANKIVYYLEKLKMDKKLIQKQIFY